MPSKKGNRPTISKCANRAYRRPVAKLSCLDQIDDAAADEAAPARLAKTDLWAYEKKARDNGHLTIAGIDEAGRGPLAGPVVAAAVILPDGFPSAEVNDSKQLSPIQRDRLYEQIYAQAVAVGIGIVDAIEIDRINILRASLLAMAMAASNLDPAPDCLLVDGNCPVPLALAQQTIVKGDALSLSIAAASIVAKVTRDRLMTGYDQDYPQYGFAGHKGYGTHTHREAIGRHGCCPIHRRSFKGVKEFSGPPKARQLPLTTGDG
ncbi:MAG: ribonuclease HII [Desulfobacterales bacterium]